MRYLAPLVDGRSGSPGESTLRLRWIELSLPEPECQVEVPAWNGGSFFIDLGVAHCRLGAEYLGEDIHGEDEEEHDEARLAWLRTELGRVIVVVRKHNVYGRDQDVDGLLVAGAREAGLLPAR